MTLKEARKQLSDASQSCADLGRGSHLLSEDNCVAIEISARMLLSAVALYREERLNEQVNTAV